MSAVSAFLSTEVAPASAIALSVTSEAERDEARAREAVGRRAVELHLETHGDRVENNL